MIRHLVTVLVLVVFAIPSGALAWDPLRSENDEVKRGNTLMTEGDYVGALTAYDEAAAELPTSKGVQLNRGLALLAQDAGEQARDAFLAAADPAAPPEVRADAYYDLGVAFAQQGDVLADKDEYEQAMTNYRESVDAFKRSLRVRPGDRNAAWNLEYALQRIREQEEKQEQQNQEQQDQEQQDQEQQDQEQQEQQDQEQPEDPQQDQDQGQRGDSQQEQEQQQDEQQQQDQEQQDQEQPQESNEEQQDQEQRDEPQQGGQQEESEETMRPEEVRRFLDALEQNEENLPLERARRQGAGRRPPEKDW